MKKKFLTIIAVLCVLTALFALVACNLIGGNTPSGSTDSGEINSGEQQPNWVKLKIGELSYNENTRVLSWDKIENAIYIELKIFLELTTEEQWIGTYRLDVDVTSYTMNFLESGKYTIQLQAKVGNKYTDIVKKSINYVALSVSDEMVKLQTPQNLKYNSKSQQVSWNKVENAVRYEIILSGLTYLTDKTIFDMSKRIDDIYTFTIKAIGDNVNYLHSDTSSITFEKETIIEKIPLGTVKKIVVEDFEEEDLKMIISWSRCNDADGYELVINGKSYFLNCIESTIYTFRGEPGHYEVKVRAIANEENEKYVSGEFTVLEGGFDIPPEVVTYEKVMTKLDEKIEKALKAKYTLGTTYRGIIGANAISGTLYLDYSRTSTKSMSTITLEGIGDCNTIEELNAYVNNLNITTDMISSQTRLMSQEDANTLVTNALNKGHITNLQGYTFDDVEWCTATTLSSYNVTSITVVTKDNHIVTYELYVQNNSIESYVQDEGHEIRSEQINDYADLFDRFKNQQV